MGYHHATYTIFCRGPAGLLYQTFYGCYHISQVPTTMDFSRWNWNVVLASGRSSLYGVVCHRIRICVAVTYDVWRMPILQQIKRRRIWPCGAVNSSVVTSLGVDINGDGEGQL